MPQVWLNEFGVMLYPHLANEWLDVYGFESASKSFVIWDKVVNKWVLIGMSFCEGKGM